VCGTAGSGKTYLIRALKQVLGSRIHAVWYVPQLELRQITLEVGLTTR